MKKNYRVLSFLLACIFFISLLASCSGGDAPDHTASDDTVPDHTVPDHTVPDHTVPDYTVPDYTVPDDTTTPATVNWPEVEGKVIYVDAMAAEGGNGSMSAPYASIADARTKIRKIKSAGALPKGGITVLVASGEYDIKNGISFTEKDSGTKTSPIKYMSAEKGGAVLNGGVTLSAYDFEPLSDEEKALLNDETAGEKILKVDLGKYGMTVADLGVLHNYGFASPKSDNTTGYSELFINGERMTLARYPNADAATPYLRTGIGDGSTTFRLCTLYKFEEQAVAIKDRSLNWNIDDLWAFGYFIYGWADSAVKVANLDAETLTVTLAQAPNYGIELVKPFYFYNIFAEMDVPGEYYIDRENLLLYVYPTENFEDSVISVSFTNDNLISLLDASYITIDGFELTGSRTNGVVISGDNITVQNCTISDVRYDAVRVTGTNINVLNNEICYIGESGIIANGGNAETLTSAGIIIYNNYIHHWAQVGRTYESGIELGGCGVVASHNELHDAPHQAITWKGPNHIIEYNEIYNVCLDTDDCGALYSGRRYDWYGVIIRYNFIHDVGASGARAHGIYLDDALSGQTVYGNIIANVSGRGIMVGGGRDNVIENNLIVNTANNPLFVDTRARDGMLNGEENLHYSVDMPSKLVKMQAQDAWLNAFPGYGDIIPYSIDYAGDPDDPMLSCNPGNNTIRMNMCYTVGVKRFIWEGNPNVGNRISSEAVSMGTVENNYEITDLEHAQFPGYENGDYTLAGDAEAYRHGFESLPFEEMGRIEK